MTDPLTYTGGKQDGSTLTFKVTSVDTEKMVQLVITLPPYLSIVDKTARIERLTGDTFRMQTNPELNDETFSFNVFLSDDVEGSPTITTKTGTAKLLKHNSQALIDSTTFEIMGLSFN